VRFRAQYRRGLVLAAALAVAGLCGQGLAGAAGPDVPPGNRAPRELAFSPDGRLLYITEAAEDSVAVVDRAARRVLRRFPTGGSGPAGLAVSADGRTLLIANSASGSVVALETATGRETARWDLPGEPWGVALAPDGRRAYVTLSQLDQVAVLALPGAEVVARVPVGRRPRALALTRDGQTLAVANQTGGSVSVLATQWPPPDPPDPDGPAAPVEEARVRLKGLNVRGLAVGAQDAEVYATVMPAFNLKPTNDPAMIWHNLVQAVNLNGTGSSVGEDQWLDFVRRPGALELVGAPDPAGIALDAEARFAWFAVSGRDVLTRITIHDRRRDAIWPISQIEAPVGANPRAVALSPDGKEVWVANYLGNSLTVVDAATMKAVETVDLGPASRRDPALAGKRLFHSAGMTRTQRFTCASCHPDGGADGLTWTFTHVKDGFRRRNTRDLRTGVAETAPFRWSGLERHLEEFLTDEVTGLLGGPAPVPRDLRALAEAVRAFEPPPNPWRKPDGGLTEAAERGKALFMGRAGCGACHAGPRHGGTGAKVWIGTTPPGQLVDVPHLTGVHDGAPYLHDGRAESLEDIWARFDPEHRHGAAARLDAAERADLLRYVREL